MARRGDALGSPGLDPVAADVLVPFVAVTFVVDAITFGSDDADDDRRVKLAMPIDFDAIADFVLVRLRRLDRCSPHLRRRLWAGRRSFDATLDPAPWDRLIPDLVVPVVVNGDLSGAGNLDDHRRVNAALPFDQHVVADIVSACAAADQQGPDQGEGQKKRMSVRIWHRDNGAEANELASRGGANH